MNEHDLINSQLYQELIIEHGTKPRNFGKLFDPNYQATGYNPLCGDEVDLFLLIEKQQILKASFQGRGCAIATASASIMTELLLGKSISQALKLFEDFVNCITTEVIADNIGRHKSCMINNGSENLPTKLLALLGVKNYPSRVKCATLAWHALRSALITTDELNIRL